eukprot:1134904-Rhodomonas_salina.1
MARAAAIGTGGRMLASHTQWIPDPQMYQHWTSHHSSWRMPPPAFRARQWIIPINIPQEHWFLIFIDFDAHRFHVEDSLGADRPEHRKQ